MKRNEFVVAAVLFAIIGSVVGFQWMGTIEKYERLQVEYDDVYKRYVASTLEIETLQQAIDNIPECPELPETPEDTESEEPMGINEQLEGISSLIVMQRVDGVSDGLYDDLEAEYTGEIVFRFQFPAEQVEWPTDFEQSADAILIIASGSEEAILGYLTEGTPVYSLSTDGTITHHR